MIWAHLECGHLVFERVVLEVDLDGTYAVYKVSRASVAMEALF